jgi:hypothetical protein
MKTVWIYVNTSKYVGDVDHIKVFASEQAAEKWLAENDPEGVAFEYPSSELARNDLLGAVVCLRVPDLTRSAGININERLLLRGRKDRLG